MSYYGNTTYGNQPPQADDYYAPLIKFINDRAFEVLVASNYPRNLVNDVITQYSQQCVAPELQNIARQNTRVEADGKSSVDTNGVIYYVDNYLVKQLAAILNGWLQQGQQQPQYNNGYGGYNNGYQQNGYPQQNSMYNRGGVSYNNLGGYNNQQQYPQNGYGNNGGYNNYGYNQQSQAPGYGQPLVSRNNFNNNTPSDPTSMSGQFFNRKSYSNQPAQAPRQPQQPQTVNADQVQHIPVNIPTTVSETPKPTNPNYVAPTPVKELQSNKDVEYVTYNQAISDGNVAYEILDYKNILDPKYDIFKILGFGEYRVGTEPFTVMKTVVNRPFNSAQDAAFVVGEKLKDILDNKKYFVEMTVPVLYGLELNENNIQPTKSLMRDIQKLVLNLHDNYRDHMKFSTTLQEIMFKVNKMCETARVYFIGHILSKAEQLLSSYLFSIDDPKMSIELEELTDLLDIFVNEDIHQFYFKDMIKTEISRDEALKRYETDIREIYRALFTEIFHMNAIIAEMDIKTLAYARDINVEYKGYLNRDIPFIEDKEVQKSLIRKINNNFIVHTVLERVLISNVTPDSRRPLTVRVEGFDNPVDLLLHRYAENRLLGDFDGSDPYDQIYDSVRSATVIRTGKVCDPISPPMIIGAKGRSTITKVVNISSSRRLYQNSFTVLLDGVNREILKERNEREAQRQNSASTSS